MQDVRGTMRLKSMIHGHAVKNQSAFALLCMQMLVRVQAQIRSRRIKMAEENKAIESQQELKFERELEKLKLQQQGDKWDDSIRTTEQHNSHLKFKQESVIRRERALSYSHRLCGSDTKDLENCKNEFYEDFTMDDVGHTFENYEELFGGTHDQSGQLFDDAGIDSFFDMKEILVTIQIARGRGGLGEGLKSPFLPYCSSSEVLSFSITPHRPGEKG